MLQLFSIFINLLDMPEISRFFGIIIYMYVREHEPPHFHANYQGYRSIWSIENSNIIVGGVPPRIQKYVRQWAELHKEELLKNWERCKNNEQPIKIPTL